MTSTTQSTKTTKCGTIYYPRIPYTHLEQSKDLCCIGCNKVGIGSNNHDPSQNKCSDNALCCFPCYLVLDILCCIPMCIGCYNVVNPN